MNVKNVNPYLYTSLAIPASFYGAALIAKYGLNAIKADDDTAAYGTIIGAMIFSVPIFITALLFRFGKKQYAQWSILITLLFIVGLLFYEKQNTSKK